MEEQVVKEIRQDKLEIRQMAKGQVCYTLTAYEFGGLDHPEEFVQRVKKLKSEIEKQLDVTQVSSEIGR